MPIKNLTLGLCALLGGATFAQADTYKVREGDTLSGIASKFHTSSHAIMQANGLSAKHRLKVGLKLSIPSLHSSGARNTKSVPNGGRSYTVRNGDFDWAIAKRNGLTVSQLHSLNPEVHWKALQVGTRIHLPGRGSSVVSSAPVVHHTASKVTTHKVRRGENNWIIAHRYGVSTVVLRALNHGADLNDLQPGQVIRVPKTGFDSPSSGGGEKINRIHTRYALVNSDDVTIRRKPTTSAGKVASVDTGTGVAVLDRDGAWYKLRFPKGSIGWVRGDFLNPARSKTVARRRSEGSRIVRRSRGTRNSYVAMNLPSGGSSDSIIARAESFSGVRYRWGSASRSGTDCSGLTTQVFRGSGIRLPRTSAEQSQVGQRVSRGDMKPGDLVFFHTSRGHRVNHVGIYMGDGKFIHASSGAGHVRVSSLDEGFYQRRFVGARRVRKFQANTAKKVAAAPKKPEVVASDPEPAATETK